MLKRLHWFGYWFNQGKTHSKTAWIPIVQTYNPSLNQPNSHKEYRSIDLLHETALNLGVTCEPQIRNLRRQQQPRRDIPLYRQKCTPQEEDSSTHHHHQVRHKLGRWTPHTTPTLLATPQCRPPRCRLRRRRPTIHHPPAIQVCACTVTLRNLNIINDLRIKKARNQYFVLIKEKERQYRIPYTNAYLTVNKPKTT